MHLGICTSYKSLTVIYQQYNVLGYLYILQMLSLCGLEAVQSTWVSVHLTNVGLSVVYQQYMCNGIFLAYHLYTS